ncbi:MerR family transcriptional regulator [Streptomyces sp. TRM 70351]|uniref:transcriptional regulator FtsR n=1 Tax=Streptomyces sp. TRM 70351 TaxID=3116552 RepID=UPI002E7B4A41|nr:MerR family transcriptional regulator [Streptomyces sp. TRM 70351]MEE1931352.1 MerR family transcriptional regulator [Streptomyces sp. TRM 70351]
MHTPSGGAGHGTAAAERGPMSIGTVLGLLREEFPEVTVSKIRFLESEGLVEPQRTPSGYRKFSAKDVERLAFVLRMQRDHYLPLKVIREQLDAIDRGEQVVLPGPAQPRDLLEGAADPSAAAETLPSARVGRAELLAAAEAGEEQLSEWESYGLVAQAADGGYEPETVEVARLVADLGRYGLQPRHLRVVKAAADREAGLVEQVVAPLRRHRNPQTRVRAQATARELASLSVRLHAALVQAALREQLQDPRY